MGELRVQGEIFVQLFPQVPHEGVRRLGILFAQALRRGADDIRPEGAAVVIEVLEAGSVFALHEDFLEVVGETQGLLDLGDDADAVQVVETGLLHLDVLLGHEEDKAVIHLGDLHRLDGLLSSDIKMVDGIRENDGAPQRDHRHRRDASPSNRDLFTVRHKSNAPFRKTLYTKNIENL